MPRTVTAEDVLTPLIMTQFFTVSFTTGVVPRLPNLTTSGVDGLVFVIVKLLSVPPEIEPSMIKRLAPTPRIRAFADALPVITRGAPVGRNVTVKGDAKAFSPTVPVSPARFALTKISTFPVTSLLLMNSNIPPAFVSDGNDPGTV